MKKYPEMNLRDKFGIDLPSLFTNYGTIQCLIKCPKHFRIRSGRNVFVQLNP